MNLKLRVVSMAAVFFTGSLLMAQRTPRAKKDTITEKTIDEVVVTGYRTTTKKKAVTTVTTINSETIENRPNANVLNTLQGQAAGVNIASGSGQPGQKPTVIIRGISTVNGSSDPLYVIDGFPSNSDSFRSINPNDIESLSVLKDASAISEYGSRGSNGVILIKTKNGRFNQKLSVKYTGIYGVATLQNPKYNYASSSQLLTLEKRYGVGLGSTLTQAAIDAYPINTNWKDVFFRPAVTQSHDLAITSGGENVNSYTSVGYYNQDGVLKTTGLQRFTVRNNIDGRSENKKLTYSLNTGLGYSKNNVANSLGTGAINRNFLSGSFTSAPYVSSNLYQHGNGQQVLDLYSNDGTLLYTPLFLQDKLDNFASLTDEIRLDMAASAAYKLTNDLTASIRASGQYLSTTFFESEFPTSFNALLFQGGNQFAGYEQNNTQRQFLFNNLYSLKYEKKLGKHSFALQGNGEYNYSQRSGLSVYRYGLDPKTYVPGSGSGYAPYTGALGDPYAPVSGQFNSKLSLISYFASFDYDYDSKFGLLVTGRRDGTSVLSGDRQFGNFWAMGGRINLESFLNSPSIQMLKLHGSIGTAGNQRFISGGTTTFGTSGTIFQTSNPPRYQDVFSSISNAYNGQQGIGIGFGYPELRWETTRNTDLAVDFDLFRRLSGSVGIYQKKTYDLYLSVPQSPVLGSTSILQNSPAILTNKGVEVDLKYAIIKNENMQLTIRGNGSENSNKFITPLAERDFGTTTELNGASLDEFKLYHYDGVNQANGNPLYTDINGNLTENPLDGDRKLTGKNYLPKYQGGFGFDFKYKGFFASTTFTFVKDIWRIDYNLQGNLDPGNLGTFNVQTDLLNAWTPTNTNTNIPALTANLGYDGGSDRFLKDASYVRLRNAQIGYEFPKTLLAGTSISGMSITLQGENLVTWTKWQGHDAESNRAADQYQYPTPKIYTLGLSVKF
ncbi:MAG: SusC/RagA family TonB-linked outer membrane protein [Oligoflexus sp.]|nr:SusC/RagA family TonB-linked outer membrane protein [Pseudopedobacter sp.]